MSVVLDDLGHRTVRSAAHRHLVLLVLGLEREGRDGGGPAGETTTLPLYVANTSVDAHDFGYASALTTVAFVILLFFSMVYLRLSKFGGEEK